MMVPLIQHIFHVCHYLDSILVKEEIPKDYEQSESLVEIKH